MCLLWQLGFLLVGLAFVIVPAEDAGVVADRSSVTDATLFSFGRRLADASSITPTIDEVDNVILSRPPHSLQETSSIVYASTAALYMLCAIILLVAANLDASERRRRRARAIVPEESVPCAIAEQYFLDEHLVNMRSSQDLEIRKQRKGFFSFLLHYGVLYPDILARQHLFVSLLVQAVPTFTRTKRGILIVIQLHLCMLTAAFAYNVLEHDKPNGVYEMLSCSGELATKTCTATLPMSLLAGVVAYPVFRFVACRQMRLTCFASQSHPSSSQFPLNVRKFARIPAKSAWESVFCMRNAHERRQVQVLQQRSFAHRVMQMLWRTIQPSAKDLRFYSVFTSWCILLAMLTFIGLTLFYVIMFTAYLDDEVVYHWLAWTLTMFFSSIFVLEPLQIFFVEVFWCALVANFAQRWSFGAHALAGTTRYKDQIRTVDQLFIKDVRAVAATRVQRWWVAVLDMYRAINEQTSATVNFQAISKKNIHHTKYTKERKWCLKLEVQDCYDLEQVHDADLMSPFIKLQCDVGNPHVQQTKVAWDDHKRASFNEHFFVDIKEAQSMYVSVWSKTPSADEFIGRGYFEFSELKNSVRNKADGQDIKVTLHDIEHGEARSRMKKARGTVNLHVKFLDPAQERTCDDGDAEETSWMLPKHRMQFALSKMGGRIKVSKMLGGLGAPMIAPVPVKVPSYEPMKLDTASGWQVGGRSNMHSGANSNNDTPYGSHPVSPSATAYRSDQPASFLDNKDESASGARSGAQPGPAAYAAAVLPPGETAPMSLNSVTNAGAVSSASAGRPSPPEQLPGAINDDEGI